MSDAYEFVYNVVGPVFLYTNLVGFGVEMVHYPSTCNSSNFFSGINKD